MKKERDFIIQALRDAGIRGKIHESMKSLKNCNEVHLGAVLRTGESFVRSGSKKRYTDQQGQRKQRNRLFERKTNLHVVIADTDETKVEGILTLFLKGISITIVSTNPFDCHIYTGVNSLLYILCLF